MTEPSTPDRSWSNRGPSFLYSNCRQFTSQLRPTRLQRLAPGSLILFGSNLRGRFVLDTVLVVGSRTPYTIGQPDQPSDRVPRGHHRAAGEDRAATRPDRAAPPRRDLPGSRSRRNVQLRSGPAWTEPGSADPPCPAHDSSTPVELGCVLGCLRSQVAEPVRVVSLLDQPPRFRCHRFELIK
jgi:hypothetical protein